MNTLIIHTNQLSAEQITFIEKEFETKLHTKNNHFRLQTNELYLNKITAVSRKLKIDINALPDGFNGKQVKMLISDMDSTLIGIECIDEIADMNNIKPQVAEITESAMRGEIDFESSLIQRVKLLKGLNISALDKVFEERLFLNKGAEEWIDGLKQKNIKFALVSGGFTFFTDRLQKQLKLDYSRANVLEEKNGLLTGKVLGKIIAAQAKADFLHELCHQLKIKPNQVIAIGDGANDLSMMKEAALSIAYRAKPTVQVQADAVFNYSNLESVLDFLD